MSTWSRWTRVLGIAVATSLVLTTGASAVVVFNVNSRLDKIDDNTSDYVCHTAANTCTLRAAVMQANAVTDQDVTIVLPAGTYFLTLPEIIVDGADAAVSAEGDDGGDLKLTTPITTPITGYPIIAIVGAGRSRTIIDANQQSRVLRVHTDRTAILYGLTLRNGKSLSEGGGILNTGSLFLNRGTVSGNAGRSGGGIFNFGVLHLNDCTISGNSAQLQGGGMNTIGYASIERTEVMSNVAVGDGGGIFYLRALHATASTVALNTSHRDGGGIYSPASVGEDLTLINATIYGNSADRNGGGIYFGSPPPFNAASSARRSPSTAPMPTPIKRAATAEASTSQPARASTYATRWSSATPSSINRSTRTVGAR